MFNNCWCCLAANCCMWVNACKLQNCRIHIIYIDWYRKRVFSYFKFYCNYVGLIFTVPLQDKEIDFHLSKWQANKKPQSLVVALTIYISHSGTGYPKWPVSFWTSPRDCRRWCCCCYYYYTRWLLYGAFVLVTHERCLDSGLVILRMVMKLWSKICLPVTVVICGHVKRFAVERRLQHRF